MKKIIQKGRLGLIVFLLAFASSSLWAAPANSGIKVQTDLYISYGTPIEEEPGVWVGVGDVQLPVAASFSVWTAYSGEKIRHLVGHFSTDASGVLTLPLPLGKYVVVPDALPAPYDGSDLPGSFVVMVRSKNLTPVLVLYYQDGPLSVL